MPKLKTVNFSNQTNRSFKILSEFLNILDKSSLFSIKNLLFHNGVLIIGTVFSNRIYIFLKNKQKLSLINLFEEKNQSFKSIGISKSGNRIIAYTNNAVIVYTLNETILDSSEKSYNTLQYLKLFNFFDIKEPTHNISFACFNKDETFLIISYQNGILRIVDLIKKSFFDLNIKVVFEKLCFPLDYSVSGKIFGKTISNFFVEYNILTKKIIFSKQIQSFLIKYNYIILQNQESIEFRCFCHNKKIKNIILPILCRKIVAITPNKLLIENNNSFFWLKIGHRNIENCLIDFHLNEKIFIKNENIRKIFICNNNCVNFTLTLVTDINSVIFLKPISEKHKILLNYNSHIYNLGEIYAIKFFGTKFSILVAANNSYINLYEGKNFYFKGFYRFKNSIFLNIEIKGNILIANNTFGQIIFWKMDTFDILTWIDNSKQNSNVFSLFKKIEYEGFLITGGKDCIVKLWKIKLKSKSKIEIILVSQKKIEKNKICIISTYKDGNTFATASSDKKIFLWKTTLKDPYLQLEKFKRSIWSLNFSPKDEILITGTSDGFIYFFNILNGYCLKKIAGHDSSVTNCLFNYDGSYLYTSDSKGKIKTWRLNTETCTNVIAKQKGCIWALCIDENNTFIASGCNNGTIIIIKDIASDSFFNKKQSYQHFLNLQQIFNNHFDVLKNIFMYRDIDLMFDFLKFLFTNFFTDFEYIIGSFIRIANISQLKFLCRSIITWNLEKKKTYFSQNILKIILINKAPFFFKMISAQILDALLISTNNIKKLFNNYKQIIC
nr:transducin (beta) 3-like protein [Cryptomonas curvata]